MDRPKIIRRPPGFEKARLLAGKWYDFERCRGDMTPLCAQEIADQLLSCSLAKRQGKYMPKGWKSAHPSMPYQYGALAERILAHPIVTTANYQQAYDFELTGSQA